MAGGTRSNTERIPQGTDRCDNEEGSYVSRENGGICTNFSN